MKRAITVAALAAASVGLAAGCSGSSTTAVAPACPGGAPRIQETTGGPWVCDPDSPAAAPAASAQPANPVAIVKQAGAVTSAKLGDVDVYGDRYAQGDIPGATIPGCEISYSTDSSKCLESVQVYTFADQAAQQADLTRNPPQDGQETIAGNLFDVTVYSVSGSDGVAKYPVSVATIAARVHGKIVTPAA